MVRVNLNYQVVSLRVSPVDFLPEVAMHAGLMFWGKCCVTSRSRRQCEKDCNFSERDYYSQ